MLKTPILGNHGLCKATSALQCKKDKFLTYEQKCLTDIIRLYEGKKQFDPNCQIPPLKREILSHLWRQEFGFHSISSHKIKYILGQTLCSDYLSIFDEGT